jgi:hypothetical protein
MFSQEAIVLSDNGSLIINAMAATRNPKNVDRKFVNNTEFQIHISQQTNFHDARNVIDFTERKLIKLINKSTAQRALILTKLLYDYSKGNVVISWNNGEPTFINVTRER